MTWPYSDPQFREDLHNGTVQLDQQKLVSSYREWVKEERWLQFQHKETGDVVKVMSPRRGNVAYANRQRRKYKKILDAMEGMVWDKPSEVPGARRHNRETHMLLVTMTFDHSKYSQQESWHLVTARGKAMNRFSARVTRVLGSKATVKIKEGSQEGHPHPHILVAVDRPIQCFRYKNKWRIRSQETLRKLKEAWPYGFVDVEAVVGGEDGAKGAMGYVTKYLQKTCRFQPMDEVQPTVAELTHSWSKVYGCRDIVTKHFLSRLEKYNADPQQADELHESEWEMIGLTDHPPYIKGEWSPLHSMWERWQNRIPPGTAS